MLRYFGKNSLGSDHRWSLIIISLILRCALECFLMVGKDNVTPKFQNDEKAVKVQKIRNLRFCHIFLRIIHSAYALFNVNVN